MSYPLVCIPEGKFNRENLYNEVLSKCEEYGYKVQSNSKIDMTSLPLITQTYIDSLGTALQNEQCLYIEEDQCITKMNMYNNLQPSPSASLLNSFQDKYEYKPLDDVPNESTTPGSVLDTDSRSSVVPIILMVIAVTIIPVVIFGCVYMVAKKVIERRKTRKRLRQKKNKVSFIDSITVDENNSNLENGINIDNEVTLTSDDNGQYHNINVKESWPITSKEMRFTEVEDDDDNENFRYSKMSENSTNSSSSNSSKKSKKVKVGKRFSSGKSKIVYNTSKR